MSDSEHEIDLEPEPPVVDPYETLDLERDATADQIKSAYRKAALKNHPDKVATDKKDSANKAFQEIAFAYAILSDPVRRKRYDTTGSTSESIVDSEGFDWSDFYREQFKDAISEDAIKKFAAQYKGSDEERDDLLVAFERGEGDMDHVYESVMLSNVLEDDERFRKIIDEAIESRDVPAFKAYSRESGKRRTARVKAARAEAREAEEYAEELGVRKKLFGDGGSETNHTSKQQQKKKKKRNDDPSQDGLAALILKRQDDRGAKMDSFLDGLAAKYAPDQGKQKKKGKKRAVEEEEPSEEAFQAAAARLGGPKGKKSRN